MKRAVWLGVAVIAVFLVALVAVRAYACDEKPPEPVCEAGETTVTPAQWVDGYTTAGHWEVRNWIDTTYKKECKQVEVLTCPVIDGVTYDKSNDPHKCHRPSNNQLQDHPYHMTKNQAKAYTQNHDEWVDALVSHKEECKMVVDVAGHWGDWKDGSRYPLCLVFGTCRYVEGEYVPGYWTDPVCETPPEVCEFDPLLTADDPLCQPPPDMCEYNQTIKADDPLCVPPPPPPIEPECEWKGTGTAVFELWSGPDYTGDYATMYVYDFGDGYPEGVSVQRQSCVLGWVAQTDTGPWEIDRNTCSGNLRWHGLEFIPSERVIRHQACARDGECLK